MPENVFLIAYIINCGSGSPLSAIAETKTVFIQTILLQVPHTTFLLTHTCFLFYHVISNMTLRRLRHSIADLPHSIRMVTEAAWVLALSYFIAYLETIAILNVSGY